MADDKGCRTVPTNSDAYLKILRKLVELWWGASAAIQADEVMHETPVKEQTEEEASRGRRA
jgi:hypothetical protein